MSMSDALKFYKGNESDLPELIAENKIEVGAIYHCEDTGNTYRGVSANQLTIFSSAIGRRFIDDEGAIGGEIYGNYGANSAPYQFSEAHGDHTFTTDANQAVFGKYNDEYYSKRKLFVLGDGSSEKSHNVMSIDELGRIWINDDRMTVTPLIFFGDLDYTNITERGTSLDSGWYEVFETLDMGSYYPQCYMILTDLNSSNSQPLKLILTEWNEVSDYSERWFKFRGITEDQQLCTITLQWSPELGFHYPVEYIPLSGTSELTLYYDWNHCSNWYNESSTLNPGNIIVEFIPVDSGDFTNYQNITGFEINGKVYGVTQNKISVQEDFLLYKHLYHFDGEAFELLETIPSINNGINVSVGHTADARYLYDPEADKNMSITPLLVGLMTEYKSTPEVKAFVNKEKPILANLTTGQIDAPGGLHTAGHDWQGSYNQEITYDATGITYEKNQGVYESYNMAFLPTSIKIHDTNNEIKFLEIDTTIGDDNPELFYTGNIVARLGLYAEDTTGSERRIPHTYYGTTPPDNELGVDGDVYIMYSNG